MKKKTTPKKGQKGVPYLDIPTKLTPAFGINELCKETIIAWLAKNGFEKKALQVLSCGTKSVLLACPNGHQKVVRTTCHKEFCPRCGQTDSLLHIRSKTRAYDRLLWADILGYMVFTLPKEISDLMPEREQLSKLEKGATKIIKDNFSTPGCMVKTHLMGEEPEKLHIHFNVLFPVTDTNGIGKVPQNVLDDVRLQWTEFVNKTFKKSLETTNAFYKFATTERKKMHLIKYVTRPIVTAERFLTLPDEAKFYFLSLQGWHNTRWYGKLANSKYKAFLEEKGIDPVANREKEIALSRSCPVCGNRYKFQEFIDVEDITKTQFRQYTRDIWIDLETFAALKDKAPPD